MQSPAIGFYGEPEEFDGGHYCPGLIFADGGPPVLIGDDIVRLSFHADLLIKPLRVKLFP